VAASNK